MNSRWTKIWMLALVVAIAIAQTHGIRRGFVCDCAGMERLTQADHCHDDSAGAGQDDCEEPLVGHAPADDTREHGELTESLMAKVHHIHGVAFVSMVVKVLSAGEWLAELGRNASEPGPSYGGRASRSLDPPPWAERLVHVIALRV